MKKNLTHILIIIAAAVPFLFSGCILDALNSVTQNIPISKEFNISSSATSYSDSTTIDLSNSTTYQRYENKIQQVKFITAQYRTKSVTPSGLSGDITITLKNNSGIVLFTQTLNNVKPADFENTPFKLSLNSAEISLINTYLSNLSNKTFVATISITNISSSSTTYTLKCSIDIVFEMKAKTS